jgi:APA family basic amino acid/polyamine antiporter
MFSTMLVQLIGQTRIFYAMSRDGLLPEMFGRVHPRFRTPHVSTIVTAIVISIAAGLLPIDVLAQLVSMGTLLAFVLACVGILVLRRTAPNLERPFRTPWMPWVPILGAASCFIQMVVLPWETWVRLVVWLAVGLAIYLAYGRARAAERRRSATASAADNGGSEARIAPFGA